MILNKTSIKPDKINKNNHFWALEKWVIHVLVLWVRRVGVCGLLVWGLFCPPSPTSVGKNCSFVILQFLPEVRDFVVEAGVVGENTTALLAKMGMLSP